MDRGFRGARRANPHPRPPAPVSGEVVLLAAVYFPRPKSLCWRRYRRATPPRCGRHRGSPSRRSCCRATASGRVWLGASLVNVTVQSSLLAATLMGAGNTQALAGAALVRAAIGFPERSAAAGRGQIVAIATAARRSRRRSRGRRSPSCTLCNRPAAVELVDMVAGRHRRIIVVAPDPRLGRSGHPAWTPGKSPKDPFSSASLSG